MEKGVIVKIVNEELYLAVNPFMDQSECFRFVAQSEEGAYIFNHIEEALPYLDRDLEYLFIKAERKTVLGNAYSITLG